MSSLSPVQQQVLDQIASGESHNYNTIFGGHKFTSFADHPQIKIPLPNGQYTTAAGRYQMTAPTWQAQKSRLGLKDFSPQSQDLAALDLAQRTYQQKTGRDLVADTAAGCTQWSALGNQWTSLRGKGPAPSMTASLLPSNPLALGGLGSSGAVIKPSPGLNPNPGSELDPALAMASLRAAAPGVSLSPVEHNPWSLAPSLIPVSHNPFQEASNAQQ